MFKKRIIVIDTDAEFRLLVASILKLSEKFILVAEFSSFSEALKEINKLKPDIVITDLYFPGHESIECLKILIERLHLINILVITDSDEEDFALDSIYHGAIGFLLKNDVPFRLLDSLEWIIKGGSPLDFKVARLLINRMQLSKITPLTRKESAVLKLITEGKTYSMIANELHISNETSKTHIRNIYRKLNVNSKSEAVRKAIEERLVQII